MIRSPRGNLPAAPAFRTRIRRAFAWWVALLVLLLGTPPSAVAS